MAPEKELVQLIGFWGSPYVLSVRWALKLKGIEYEYHEENLLKKSPLLLQYNPVYKKVPVLLHNGKPLVESLMIIQYIDETWKQNPLQPQDPYERAKTLFWAKFAHEKCIAPMVSSFFKIGEEQEKCVKEACEHLRTLESALEEGKRFFGGETIGFVDIAAAWMGCWARIIEEILSVKLIDEEKMPRLIAWFSNVVEVPALKECMPPTQNLLEHNIKFRKFLVAAAERLQSVPLTGN
ncbi:unnamed protein product [Fraxinus pennsylvanica]|uniref:Probable glutathione S-transferase n=1 Tax=Fraxinus pennsylvanica TaxID=56036 RepID=A0AAD1YYT6_9LAMI|nr:unnamed protein product [Fraxinus pennsylvanica]